MRETFVQAVKGKFVLALVLLLVPFLLFMRGKWVQALILLIVAFLFFFIGGKFFEALTVLLNAFFIFKDVIDPPIPSSLLFMFMAITFFAVMLYVSSSQEFWLEFLQPLRAIFLGNHWQAKVLRPIILILIPFLVAFMAYQRSFPTLQAPAELRAIHPAPPTSIQFRGKPLDIQGLENPLRKDPRSQDRYVQEGSEIYFKNCFFCHGDALDGKGPFAHGFNPPPANFRDPGTIAQLQESYVFWRIAKGGSSLPKESTPWNSAMPAWEDRLTEEEIWKVILFIYGAAGVQPRRWEARHLTSPSSGSLLSAVPFGLLLSANQANAASPVQAQEVEAGKQMYEKRCAVCHGFNGKGDGVVAPFVIPRPRDFTKGMYKIRTTPSGQLPTDQDLLRIINEGMPGTSMPGWKDLLNENERRQVSAYIKTFFDRFANKPPPEPIPQGNPVSPTPSSLDKGKELYDLMECFKCHGQEGRADGPSAPELKDEWGFPIRPANLTQPWTFRGGRTVEDIRRTFMTGLAGTPMPSYADSFENPDVDSWHLANYVRSLGPEHPNLRAIIPSRYITRELPEDPDDERWKEQKAVDFPLVGQVIVDPRLFSPSVHMVSVKSLYNDNEIAFHLTWDDPTKSTPDLKAQVYADAVAVQLPARIPEGTERPYFLMGNPGKPVNLWRWSSDGKIEEVTASGLTVQAPQNPSQQELTGKVTYQHGQYRLVLKRPVKTEDQEDLQVVEGRFIPIAFMAWDGSNGETGTKMAVSSWYYLILEESAPMVAYLTPPLAALATLALEVIFLWRLRRRAREAGR